MKLGLNEENIFRRRRPALLIRGMDALGDELKLEPIFMKKRSSTSLSFGGHIDGCISSVPTFFELFVWIVAYIFVNGNKWAF